MTLLYFHNGVPLCSGIAVADGDAGPMIGKTTDDAVPSVRHPSTPATARPKLEIDYVEGTGVPVELSTFEVN